MLKIGQENVTDFVFILVKDKVKLFFCYTVTISWQPKSHLSFMSISLDGQYKNLQATVVSKYNFKKGSKTFRI